MTLRFSTSFTTFTLLTGALLVGLVSPCHSAQYQGFTFEDRPRVGGSAMHLNGLGTRAKWIIKAYAAALYLAQKADTAEAVLAAPGPKRMQLRMMLDATSADFHKALVSGMRENTSTDELARMQGRIVQFEQVIESIGKVKSGATINLDFVPAQGTVVSVDGVAQGRPIEGADFYSTVLRIFLGDNPVDRELKKGLLGH